jgi:hypothetical protein
LLLESGQSLFAGLAKDRFKMSLGDFNFEIFLPLFRMPFVEYSIIFLNFNPIYLLLSSVHIRLLSHQLITVYISTE